MSIDLDDIEARIATGIYGDDLTDAAFDDARSALAEIIAEVERLRAALGRATSEAYDLGVKSGEGRERAAVVAWLRKQRAYGTDELLGQGFENVCGILSDAIERGEHRREEANML